MKKLLWLAPVFVLAACASKTKANPDLEKYPSCYHANPKIAAKCIEKNKNGEHVTALELENTAYPGQYK